MVCAKTEKIIIAMAKACMSPKQLAEAAGVNVSVVYRMQRGYIINIVHFGKVCKALEIEPEGYIDFERMAQRKRAKRENEKLRNNGRNL